MGEPLANPVANPVPNPSQRVDTCTGSEESFASISDRVNPGHTMPAGCDRSPPVSYFSRFRQYVARVSQERISIGNGGGNASEDGGGSGGAVVVGSGQFSRVV